LNPQPHRFLPLACLSAFLLFVALLGGGCTPPSEMDTLSLAARATLTAAAAPSATPPPEPIRTLTAAEGPTAVPADGSISGTPEAAATLTPAAPAEACLLHELAMLPSFRGDLSLLSGPTCYQLDLSMDTDEDLFWGHAEIHYTNNEDVPLPEIYLRLFPNGYSYSGGATHIDRLAVSGISVQPSFELERTAMRVPLPAPLMPDEAVDLSVDFRVAVPVGDARNFGGFSAQQGVVALAHGYPFIPVYDDEGWNVEIAPAYGDVIYADISLYDVSVTVPEQMIVVATGVELPAVVHDYGRVTRRFVSGPARDFNIILSRRYEVMQSEVEGISVNAYYLPEDREGARDVLDFASEALRIFNSRFGPYPYTELDVVPTFTSAGGIEYPGLIVIAKSLYQPGKSAEWVVVHEVAHQWWYNLVGNDQVDEPWLDEALTQYSTALYYEDRYSTLAGEQARQTGLQDRWDRVLKEGRDRPVVGSVASFAADVYSPIVYGKGALFFHALREQLGDATFDDFLRTYFQEHRYGIATAESLMAVAEAVSGRELDDLYRQWILE